MRATAAGRGWVAGALALAACSGWPLYADLPEGDPDAIPAPDDPRSLLQPEWVETDEPAANDDPTMLPFFAASRGDALLIDGALEGTGWHDEAEPVTFTDEACSTQGSRSPQSPGDWIADVDFALLIADDEGLLCAEVETGSGDVGWDLLLVEVDSCGVPVAFAADGDDPVGFGLGGAAGGWGHPVQADSRWAVLFAGYYPNDRDNDVAYRLGISLLAPSTSGLCPLLPTGDR